MIEPEEKLPVLRKHRLKHLPVLKVSRRLFDPAYIDGCSMMNCDGSCCMGGVYADVAEQDRILGHADLVKGFMEPHQEHDSSKWFDAEVEPDPDFPSGFAVGTQVRETGCVFLNSKGSCVLQLAATESGMDKHALKPFFCFAYPITIEHGVLDLDDLEYADRPACCGRRPSSGKMTSLEVCEEEFRFVLGDQGFDELRTLPVTACRIEHPSQS